MKDVVFIFLAGLLAAIALGGIHNLSTRIDRLEKDNALQQQIITDLGDKLAAHQHK